MNVIENNKTVEYPVYNFAKLRETTPDKIPNEVLSRLINEVRNDEQVLSTHSYNRFHNRHNR